MDRVTAAGAIAQLVLDTPDHADLTSGEPPTRAVDIQRRMWEVWLRDGGRPGSPSYVGPLDPARVTAARDALRHLTRRDPSRRGADHEIDRAQLLALSQLAAKSNERRCITLWVATMMWGSGTVDSRAPWRTAQGLASDDLGEWLVASHRALRAGDLAEAYRCAAMVVGAGETNFTKWLWAASLGLPDVEVRPVVLDRYVRKALDAADVRQKSGAIAYVEFVEHVQGAADLLRSEHGLAAATPEVVECVMALSAA